MKCISAGHILFLGCNSLVTLDQNVPKQPILVSNDCERCQLPINGTVCAIKGFRCFFLKAKKVRTIFKKFKSLRRDNSIPLERFLELHVQDFCQATRLHSLWRE